MPKFKHLFLAILLGSFVSSNNIGYSVEDNSVQNVYLLHENMILLKQTINEFIKYNLRSNLDITYETDITLF